MKNQDAQLATKDARMPHPIAKRRLEKVLSAVHFPHFAKSNVSPWTEVVGTVARVERDCIILECRSLVRLDFPAGVSKYRRLLKKGQAVGILMTDSGVMIRRTNS
jgi:hypothetical protein